jgi:LuxR family maltose regulon positive regulatory protein
MTSEGERITTRIEVLLQSSQDLQLAEAEVALIQRRLRLLQAIIERREFRGGYTERLLLRAQEIEALPPDEDVNWSLIPLILISGLGDFFPEKRASMIPKMLVAKRQAIQAQSHLSAVRILTVLGQLYIQTGRLHLAEQHCREGLALAAQTGLLTSLIGFLSLNLFDIFYAQNRLEEASEALCHMLSIARDWQHAYLMALGEISQVRLALARSDLITAHQALQRMEAIVSQEGYTHDFLWEMVIRVDYWLRSGRLDQACAWAASVMRYQDAREVWRKEEVLMLVRVLLAQQQYDQAVEVLARFSLYLDLPEHNHTTIHFLALSVVALYGAGLMKQAALAAGRLFALTEPEGHIRVYLDAGLPMKEALTMLLETPLADTPKASTLALSRPYISHVLAAFEQEERRQATGQENSPLSMSMASGPKQNAVPPALIEPLSRQELTVLRRLCAGETYLEMAKALFVSPNTIKTQVSSIYRKLGVSRRTEAIAEAARLHLF